MQFVRSDVYERVRDERDRALKTIEALKEQIEALRADAAKRNQAKPKGKEAKP